MNNLQGGITSSQLIPQAYKNSSQDSSFQDTFNSQNIQSTVSNQSLLYVTPSATTLSVDTGLNTAVLGVSKTSVPQNTAVDSSSNNYLPISLLVLTVSLVMTVYFLKKYKSLAVVEVESELSQSEE